MVNYFKLNYKSNNKNKSYKIPEVKYDHLFVIKTNPKIFAEFRKNMSLPSPLWDDIEKTIPPPDFKDYCGQ